MNKQVKPNPKQDVVQLKELLKEDFKGNFKKFKKIYENNSESKAFIKYFIKSDILVNHFTDLLSDHRTFRNKNKDKKSLFEEIINSYFSQDKQINSDLIQQFKENDLKMLQTIFFKKELYKSIKHINSLKDVFSKYDNFLYLTIFLNRISTDISSNEKQIINLLKKIEFTTLFNLVSYHINTCTMKVMTMNSVISDKSPDLLKEPKVIDKLLSSMAYPKVMEMVASKILNKKMEIDNKKYDLNPIKLLFEIQRFGEQPEEKKIKLIQKLFEHFKKVMELEEVVTNLKYGEFKYNFLSNTKLLLLPKDEKDYLEFKKCGKKETFHDLLALSTLEDSFSSFKGWDQVEHLNKATEKNMALSTELTLSLLGEGITINDQKIRFKEMIWVISKLAERSRRMFGEKIVGNDVKSSIQKICFENMNAGIPWRYTNIRNQQELVTASIEELKKQRKIESTPEEIISIFNFFATDINNIENRQIDLVKKPFIKIGDQYLWAYSSLAYKNLYKMITMNVFPNPQQEKGYVTEKSTGYENKICQMFKDYAFKAISQVKPQKSNDKDIDVVAYKDGYLFIVETKVTYSRLDYQSIKWHTEGALKKAEEQLNKRRDSYLNYLSSSVLKTLGINDVSEITKVVTMIVTNSFEGKVIRKNGIFKLHERELEMYLSKNSSKALLKMMENDYYWELIKEEELNLVPEKNSFKDLEVISYV